MLNLRPRPLPLADTHPVQSVGVAAHPEHPSLMHGCVLDPLNAEEKPLRVLDCQGEQIIII